MNTELKAKDLANYIQKCYIDKYARAKISPIKLQKCLYFLFGYFWKYIKKAQDNKYNIEEDFSEFSPYLFDEDIQAWTYGPVLPDIYHLERDGNIDGNIKENYLQDSEHNLEIKEFIDYLLPQLFEISDFGLVDLSHQDRCWINHYDESDEYHNQVIPKEEIIHEYCNK